MFSCNLSMYFCCLNQNHNATMQQKLGTPVTGTLLVVFEISAICTIYGQTETFWYEDVLRLH